MIVKNIDGTDFEFTPKRLRLGKFESLMVCVEAIQESTKKSTTIRHIAEAMKICMDDYDPETTDLDLESCMEIISETAKANRVSGEERKKSE
jgi:hypothetical protein